MTQKRKRLRIDIETYSSVDLIKFGVYRYAASPDFEILMAAWSLDGSPTEIAIGWDEIAAIPGLTDSEVLKVAHNAQFERICFSAFFSMDNGDYLDPEDWHDTQAVAAGLGYPQKLAMLAPALGAEPKDEAGTRLINLFCKPSSKGVRLTEKDKPMEWLDFIDYCIQDVDTLNGVDDKLEELGGWQTETEREIFMADQRVNDRGIAIDEELATHAVFMSDKNTVGQTLELIEASSWQILNPNSNPQMMEWSKAEGLDMPNFQKDTVSEVLERDLTADQRRVLELRQDLALVAAKKFSSALGGVLPDGRLRGSLKYFGAHTGRWSGRGTQVQNLPSAQVQLSLEDQNLLESMKMLDAPKHEVEAMEAKLLEAETERLIRILKQGGDIDATTLKALVRPMFLGPFTVVDYKSVEAIVLAWLAGEQWVLDAFRAKRDIYVETADRMSTEDRPLGRKQGKVAVLALGYNGAVNSLRAMGAEGTDEELMILVKQWRRANPAIVRLWQLLGDAFSEPGQVGEHLYTTHSHDALGRTVHLHLPSGRAISYHGVRWEKYKVPHPTIPNKWIAKEGWRYADPKNPYNPKQRIGTYGGRLSENATQAVARDIMAEAIVALEKAGYPVVAHVHDEILADGKHDVSRMSSIMTRVPSWATGLPIDGEGFTCARYRKG